MPSATDNNMPIKGNPSHFTVLAAGQEILEMILGFLWFPTALKLSKFNG
jgi:hypothetical protein